VTWISPIKRKTLKIKNFKTQNPTSNNKNKKYLKKHKATRVNLTN